MQNIGYAVAAAFFGLLLSSFPFVVAASVAISGCAAGLLMTFVLKARVTDDRAAGARRLSPRQRSLRASLARLALGLTHPKPPLYLSLASCG